jgi:hypothetical protein
MVLIKGPRVQPAEFGRVRAACALGDAHACERLAVVLVRLFRGDDARLASSRDASLACATARALLELADEEPSLARGSDILNVNH